MSTPTKVWRLRNLQHAVLNEPNQILSDASKASGGEEAGLSPHRLLEGALGACTAMTLQLYAHRKEWPLEKADVEVSIVEEGKASVIERKIRMHGDLTQEQKSRLLEIADKCPIHKILIGQTTIHTREL